VAQFSVAAAAAALVLSSCGGSDSNDSSGTTESSSPETSASTPESSAPAPKGDGTLVVGALLPETGDLAYLGPPQFAGVELAVDDINAAGGVLGKKVVLKKADEGDGTPDIASGSADKLLNQNADVIIGAAASTITLSVIDKITGAGVAEISGSNTTPALDDYKDGGLYFRTAPSDVLQGSVLGNMIVQDGYKNVAILARQDSYGEGLAKQLQQTIEQQGGTVSKYVLYGTDATNYTAEINKIAASKPDALALISFEEGTKILPGLIAKGVGPQDIQLYTVDGDTADYSKDFDPGILKGTKGTIPVSPDIASTFNNKLKKIDPKLDSYTYGAQVYDATVMAALAATAAQDDAGVSIASQMIAVSRDGTKCTSYADCLKLLQQGEDIDYDGVSGPVDLNDNGSPDKATIGIQLYGQDNTFKQIKTVSGVIQ